MRNGAPRHAATAVIVVVALLAASGWWQHGTLVARRPAAAALAGRPVAMIDRPTVAPNRRGHSGTRLPATRGRGMEATRCTAEASAQISSLRDRHAGGGTADEAIAHALLNGISTTDGGDMDWSAKGREFDAARRRWPENLDLAWFSAQNCIAQFGCDDQDAVRHLIARDPDNAATWVMAMEAARLSRDESAYASALHRASTSRFYDSRRGMTFLYLRPLLGKISSPRRCQTQQDIDALQTVLGRKPVAGDWQDLLAMMVEPNMPMHAALDGCRVEDPAMTKARRSDCIALLNALSADQSMIAQIVVLPMLISLTGDGPDGARQRERYRLMRWLQAYPPQPMYPPGYVQRVMTEGEMPALQAYAMEQGHWPPPADWLPDDARGRALILTGRPPPDSR